MLKQCVDATQNWRLPNFKLLQQLIKSRDYHGLELGDFMRVLLTVCLLVLAGISLSGCQTTGGGSSVGPGTGPVKLSQNAYESYQRYLNSNKPLAFALSKDGKTSAWYYCIEYGCTAHRVLGRTIAQCEFRSKGVPCHLFAKERKIVWNNPGDWQPWVGEESGDEKISEGKTDYLLNQSPKYRQYKKVRHGQKAFAAAFADTGRLVSTGYGAVRPTVADALEEALQDCTDSSPIGPVECKIVDVNNDYAGDTAFEDLKNEADRYIVTAFPAGAQKVQIALDWDEKAMGKLVDATFYIPQRSGSFFFRLQGPIPVLCRGTVEFVNATNAGWTLFCGDGTIARGSLVKPGKALKVEGKGLDDLGRQITFATK